MVTVVTVVTVAIAVTATAALAPHPLDTITDHRHQGEREGGAPLRQVAAIVSPPLRLDLLATRSTWASTSWSRRLARETLPKLN